MGFLYRWFIFILRTCLIAPNTNDDDDSDDYPDEFRNNKPNKEDTDTSDMESVCWLNYFHHIFIFVEIPFRKY